MGALFQGTWPTASEEAKRLRSRRKARRAQIKLVLSHTFPTKCWHRRYA